MFGSVKLPLNNNEPVMLCWDPEIEREPVFWALVISISSILSPSEPLFSKYNLPSNVLMANSPSSS
jgi:hypothetical protein